jgi:hypothetical protein
MSSFARTYISRFELTTSPSRVRLALLEPERWLTSWRHVRELELLAVGDPSGAGRRYRTTVRAVAPYELTWEMTLVEADPEMLVWLAAGDLQGRAELTLSGDPHHTDVRARWSVTPTPRWMRRLWPVAGRLFVRNHDAIMRRGARHLADHLDVELTRAELDAT